MFGVVLLAVVAAAGAAPPPNPPARRTGAEGVATVAATRAQSPIVVDGRLDDGAWAGVEPLGGLRRRNPDEGRDETERTAVRIVYDDFALYVAARMADRDAAAIVRQLSRRDAESNSDTITLYLDPQHDHRSGVMLQVSASGSLMVKVAYWFSR